MSQFRLDNSENKIHGIPVKCQHHNLLTWQRVAKLVLIVVLGMVRANASLAVDSGSPGTNQYPHLGPRFQFQPPPSLQALTNRHVTIFAGDFTQSQLKNVFVNDNREGKLIDEIKSQQRIVTDPDLDLVRLRDARVSLDRLEAELMWYRQHAKRLAIFQKSLQSNPATAWTNEPDPAVETLELNVWQDKQVLADPDVDPSTRQSVNQIFPLHKQLLSERQTESKLWMQLRIAAQLKKPLDVASAKQNLADYLGRKLGKIEGKTYPPGTSYDTIMDDYRKFGSKQNL